MIQNPTSREIFNKIKPAYLKSGKHTTYNSTQQSFHIHNDGSKPKPFEVDLTLSFQESRQLEQKDIRARVTSMSTSYFNNFDNVAYRFGRQRISCVF